jgi:hypothetical protein
MKKYIVILVLTLLGYESIAQKEPIAPRKPNNGEYSIEEVKAFVQSDGTVAKWCRDNLIRMINKGYETLGNTKRVDDSNFDWIFKNVSYEFKDLGPYMNSRKNNGVPEFFMDNDGWSGNAGVFRDEGVILIIFKTQCINLLDIPQKVPKTVPGPGVITKIDTIRVPASSAGTTIVLYNQNFIENSGNSSNTNTNTVSTNTRDATLFRKLRMTTLLDYSGNKPDRTTDLTLRRKRILSLLPSHSGITLHPQNKSSSDRNSPAIFAGLKCKLKFRSIFFT